MLPILAGSMPAAAMLAANLPAVGCHCPPPEPASTIMVFCPSFSTITVSGIDTNSVDRPAWRKAVWVSSTLAFLMKPESWGFSQMPS
jgi:hypothetical protein